MRIRLLAAAATALCSSPASSAEVVTWWHPNAEANDSTRVAQANVRQSTHYEVGVATAEAPDVLHDAFVYLSIPRSGRQKTYEEDDGAEFSADAGMTMSWSTFLYDSDAWVYVTLKDGAALSSADEVTIRPTTLGFHKELVDERTVRVLVPYASNGYRFSIEFDSALMTIYEDPAGALTTVADGNAAVHVEPRHGLMIFAERVLRGGDADQLVPNPELLSIHYPAEGSLQDLEHVTEEVVYFRAGTYYMDSNDHAVLPPNVRWLYLAPGAYVKGAFELRSAAAGPDRLRVTGFGIISGEEYPYEADRANGYLHRAPSVPDCHGTCLKLLEFSGDRYLEHLTVHGVTLANAPYHSFVIYGEPTITVEAANGKQIGGWYWQTDGIELYDDSSMRDMFFHLNDDVVKLYASRAHAEDIVVWKMENGPVIQWGWVPRDIERVWVENIDVIHNRMHWDAHNMCILNSARHYLDPSSLRVANPRQRIADLVLRDIRSEGMNLCAMRLYALSRWENIEVDGLWIEAWNELDAPRQASRFEALTDPMGQRVSIGNETVEGRGLSIQNYVVGDEVITKDAGNWHSNALGRLDFDASLWENWNATAR